MMKKSLSLVLAVTLIMGICSFSAFADDGCTTYPYITIDDSEDFTVVKQDTGENVTIKVVGLDASYTKHDFTDIEEDYITWTTSDSSVVKFVQGLSTVDTKTGVSTAQIRTMGTGTATVTITYDTPDDDVVSVTSYVVVEGTTYTGDETGISVEVDGDTVSDFTKTNLTVQEFELTDIFGSSFDDDDVLKNSPSAIHALLFALELQYDSDGCTDIDDANWDWDWVSTNVTITSQGSYVQTIYNDNYWEYYVNDVYGTNASSATALEEDDAIKFVKSSW